MSGYSAGHPSGRIRFRKHSCCAGGGIPVAPGRVHNQGFSFSSQNPDGVVAIWLTPGQSVVQADPFYLLDEKQPSLAISIRDEDGKSTLVNPSLATVHLRDATPTSLEWSLLDEHSQTVRQGRTEEISIKDFALEKGLYTLRVQVVDAAGNASATEVEFLIC